MPRRQNESYEKYIIRLLKRFYDDDADLHKRLDRKAQLFKQEMM